MMYGCGEYVLNHRSVGSPDAALNVLKALDVTLHNGVDSFDGQPRGLALGPATDLQTFEKFKGAFVRQLEHQVELLAEAQATIYRVTGQEASYPFLSLLYDDCIERGKPLLAGGVRYLGGTLESFGNNSAADSLLAIRQVVYEKKLLTMEQLLDCLRSDFEGHERERQLLRSVAKFGNDDAEADGMSTWLNTVVCQATRRQAQRVGLDTFMVVLINNGDSVLFGKTTAASADGRGAGEPLSNGNQPSAGSDRSGLTALLNSMSKLDPALHAGVVHNVKLSRSMFTSRRAETEGLLQGYFSAGGTQAMITVTDRRELERAMEKPEEYTNLIVRVGGYSERFVDLPRAIQLEVVKRTLY
jgi:pyruvate-formate lyase